MKMVMVVYNEAIDNEVMSALESCGVESFTKWQRVLGKGKLSSPHLDSTIWPGVNNVCMAVVDDKKISSILAQIRILRQSLGKEGVKAFILPVEEVT
jgi:nitrogen regulatory protein PII